MKSQILQSAKKPLRWVRSLLKRQENTQKTENELVPYNVMQKLLTSSQVRVILDGGAWEGDTATLLLEKFPAATVYAFEPSKELFEKLCINTRSISNIKPVNCALYSFSGKQNFYLTQALHSSSLYPTTALSAKYYSSMTKTCGTETVDAVTIDEWAAKSGISFVDVMKLDLEGAELDTLKGAQKILRTVKLVLCEVQFNRLKENCCLFSDIESFLRKCGFHLYNLYDLHSTETGRLLYGDAIFVQENVPDISSNV